MVRKILTKLRILLLLVVFLNGVVQTFAQVTCEYKIAMEIQIDIDLDLEEEIKKTGDLDKDDHSVFFSLVEFEQILLEDGFDSGFFTYPLSGFKVATPPPEF